MAGRGSLGVMSVELRANSKRLKQGLLSAQHAVRRFRRGLSSVGKDMERVGAKGSRTFSLFGAVVAGVSGKMAADFQESLAKIRTEVGITQDKIDQWRPKLLNLSEQFGKSATDMTDGLRKITSDGLRGAEAIDTLKESAKLSAIGLGDMQSIGRTLTSTLNAFSKRGLQASDAADTFLATVRYGNVNAERLAQSLSKVIGIGSSLGTSFKDIGAFFATLTRIGTPLSQASTALRGIFRAFIKHSKQAGEALANMSQKTLGTQLTFADLRKELSQKGLLSVLQTLRKVTDNNTASWAKLFPRMRGLVGVLGTISTQAGTYSTIAGEMADNTGMVDEAMQTISKTIKYKFKVALRKLQNAGIKLGTAMFPIFTKIINALGAMGKAFSSLGPGMTSAIGYFTAFVTAVFPLTWIFGKIISGIVGFIGIAETLSTYVGVLTAEALGLTGAFTGLEVVTGALTAAFTGLNLALTATGIGAIGLVIAAYVTGSRNARKATDTLKNSIVGLKDKIKKGLNEQLDHATTNVKQLKSAIQALGSLPDDAANLTRQSIPKLKKVKQAVTGRIAEIQAGIHALRKSGIGSSKKRKQLNLLTKALDSNKGKLSQLKALLDKATKKPYTITLNIKTKRQKKLEDQLKALQKPLTFNPKPFKKGFTTTRQDATATGFRPPTKLYPNVSDQAEKDAKKVDQVLDEIGTHANRTMTNIKRALLAPFDLSGVKDKLAQIKRRAANIRLFPDVKLRKDSIAAINERMRQVVDANNKYIDGTTVLTRQWEGLVKLLKKAKELTPKKNPLEGMGAGSGPSPLEAAGLAGGADSIGWLQEKIAGLKKAMKEIQNANIGPFLTKMISMVSDGIGQLSFKIGEAIGGLADGSKNIFQSLIEIIIQSAKQLASILLSIGTAIAFVPGLQGQAGLYIAAGAALMAAAGLASSLINKSGSGGGPGGGFSYSNTPGMKEGGIVPAGYPNDTYPAMLTSGEQVTPPHKLPSGGGSMDYGRLQMAFERAFNKAHITADGDSLRLVINNAQAFGR